MAGLLELLKRHKVPIPDDYEERVDAVVACLRKSPDCKKKLDAFKKPKGGAFWDRKTQPTLTPEDQAIADVKERAAAPPPLEPWDDKKGKYPSTSKFVPPRFFPDNTDYLGPRLKWLLKASASPYAPAMFEALFMVLFLLSYLESIPVFGSILSVSLDLILGGGKVLLKTIQSVIPPTFGLIPLPYSYMVGFGLSATLGMFLWPVFAIVSTSRQDFVSAIESWIRVVPPPIGDILANNFLEVNRMAGKIDEKRVKLGNDISSALTTMSGFASQISDSAKEGLTSLAGQVRGAVDTVKTEATVQKELATGRATRAFEQAPEYARRADEVVDRTSRAARVAAMSGLKSASKAVREGSLEADAENAPLLSEKKTQGGFHRRTKRKVWRTLRTRRTFARR
jgi:hypothetical protein